MGSNLVIVALPADDDPVWKVSSEQKPHLTLLFLGEADTNPHTQQIISFVEHAVAISEHGSFYMDVDYRGKLGPDEADVLFFRKDWSSRWVSRFRSQLLQEPNIKTAFDSADQYEEWTPHLTLGYPTAPAHADKIPEYGLSMVRFDRIAVWNQDYAGPEFRLEWPERMDGGLELAYSDIQSERARQFLHASILDKQSVRDQIKAKVQSILDDVTGDADGDLGSDPDQKILEKLKSLVDDFSGDVDKDLIQSAMTEALVEHHGIKGMKWGQHKAKSVVARPKNNLTKGQTAAVVGFGVAALANPKIREGVAKNRKDQANYQLDKSWEKDFQKAKSFKFDDQKFTDSYNAKWKSHDFSKEDWNKPSPTYKKYIDGYMKEMGTEYAKQFATHYGSSPSGKYEAHHVVGTDLVKLRRVDAAQHSLTDGVLVTFHITVDDNGLITGLEPVDDSVAQTIDLGVEFLAHHGVKGMKWGVHKQRASSGAKTVGKKAVKVGKALGRGANALAFELNTESDATHHRIVEDASSRYVKQLPALKKRHPNAGTLKQRMKNPLSSEARAYRADAKRMYLKQLENSANRIVSPSGNRRYTLKEYGRPNTSKYMWSVTTEAVPSKVKHAATDPQASKTITINVHPIFDEDGYIVDLQVPTPTTPSATHGEIFVDALLSADISNEGLAHHGVKGMKWGVHKNRSTPMAVAPHATSRVPHGNKRKTKIQAEGGQNHPAHEDALKVARARMKLAKSGPAALSNQELRDVANRIQLEQQVNVLTRHGAQKFVRGLLNQQGKQAAQQVVGKQVKRKLATAALL